MRRIGLWEENPPGAESLRSLAPFCHDTLKLEQWLQWVFLPGMKRVVEGGESCPSSSDISSLAEYRLAQLKLPSERLLTLIGQFDRHINSQPLH